MEEASGSAGRMWRAGSKARRPVWVWETVGGDEWLEEEEAQRLQGFSHATWISDYF